MNTTFGSKLIIRAHNQQGLLQVKNALKEASGYSHLTKIMEKPGELNILTGMDCAKFDDENERISIQCNQPKNCYDKEQLLANNLSSTMADAPVLDLRA